MRKSLYILIAMMVALLVITNTRAQQRPQYSQYFLNQYVLNPAAGGVDTYIEAIAGARFQWVGYDAAPNTQYISFHMPVGREQGAHIGHHRGSKDTWHAFGGYFSNDVTGPTRRLNGYLSYAFNMPLVNHLRLSVGVFTGFQEYRINGDQFILHDDFDNVLNGQHNTFVPDGTAGVWLYDRDFFFGVSLQQIFKNTLQFQGVSLNNVGDISELNRHLFVTSGVRLGVNHDWNFIPSFMLKTVSPAPLSVDLNGMFKYQESFWFGASYRGLDSFIGFVGGRYGKVELSYSLDITHSELRAYNYGSHEIIVGFRELWPKHLSCPSKFW